MIIKDNLSDPSEYCIKAQDFTNGKQIVEKENRRYVAKCEWPIHEIILGLFLQPNLLTNLVFLQGVVVLERLSSLLLGPVHRLCGGDLLSSPSPHTLRQCQLGTLADVRRIQVLGQW